nr:MAG TPA: tail component [Caudoviricetes sp.]
MYPPLFKAAAASDQVKALLGSDPVRVYPFGDAAEGTSLPYAVWQVISGNPENFLAGRPDIDRFGTQIDVYAGTAAAARAAAQALLEAFETVAYVTAYNGESRDPDTQNYRYSFDVEWLTRR